MYTKLNYDGTEVVVLKTKSVPAGQFEGPRGPRKLWSNTTETITRWDLNKGPDAFQVAIMGKDAEGIMSWASDQKDQIDKAFANNVRQNLAGGLPVIAGSSTHKKIAGLGQDGFDPDVKNGEFCGVIVGARSIAGVIVDPVKETQKKRVKEVDQEAPVPKAPILPFMIADQLHRLSTGLIESISSKVEQGEGITREEAYSIYEAERQIYYVLTRGLGIKANEYEQAKRKDADRRFAESKKGRFGFALRQAAEMFRAD